MQVKSRAQSGDFIHSLFEYRPRYFMANKAVQETTVKSKTQIAKYFILKRGIGKSWFLNIPEHRYNLAPWRLSRSAISIFPLAIAI